MLILKNISCSYFNKYQKNFGRQAGTVYIPYNSTIICSSLISLQFSKKYKLRSQNVENILMKQPNVMPALNVMRFVSSYHNLALPLLLLSTPILQKSHLDQQKSERFEAHGLPGFGLLPQQLDEAG